MAPCETDVSGKGTRWFLEYSHVVPLALAHTSSHQSGILVWTSRPGSRVTSEVAEPASCDHVCSIASSPIFASDQVFGGALELPGLPDGDAVVMGKCGAVADQHGIAAIDADAVLFFRGVRAEARNASRHDCVLVKAVEHDCDQVPVRLGPRTNEQPSSECRQGEEEADLDEDAARGLYIRGSAIGKGENNAEAGRSTQRGKREAVTVSLLLGKQRCTDRHGLTQTFNQPDRGA